MRRDAFGRRAHFRVLLAEPGSRVVGYASFAVGDNTVIAAPELFMHDLFVVGGWRGRGIGERLVAAVAREAAGAALRRVASVR